MSKTIVAMDEVRYRYPQSETSALAGETWHLAQGTFALVVGPSGSGKSTLLRCLNGLVPHFSGGTFGGRVLIGNRDTRSSGPRDMSQQVGFVFQDPEAQLVTDRVDSEIAFGMEQHGVPPIIMRKRVEEALDYLGINALRERQPQELSGGERQRVAIAAAIATHPDLLVLDEPTSQLDPWAAEDVLAVLSRLNDDFGMTIVISEHRLERLLHRADVVRYMPGPGEPSRVDTPRNIAGMLDDIALPPIARLGKALGHHPPPLTVKQARSMLATVPDDGPPIASSPTGAVVSSLSQVSLAMGRRTVLKDIDLQLHEGELVAIMGRNGAGKTTLLRAIAGLQPSAKGNVTTCGVDFSRQSAQELAGRVGYVPQHASSLFFRERLDAELAFTARLRGVPFDPEAMLAPFGLSGKGATHPLDLSGGERERAALATVMAGKPPLLLLDEPTRGMDAWRKHELASQLVALRQSGTAIAMVTHDVELVAECATRVIMLGDREMIADGHPREVLTDSLSYSTQVNRLFGGTWLTVDDVLHHGGHREG